MNCKRDHNNDHGEESSGSVDSRRSWDVYGAMRHTGCGELCLDMPSRWKRLWASFFLSFFCFLHGLREPVLFVGSSGSFFFFFFYRNLACPMSPPAFSFFFSFLDLSPVHTSSNLMIFWPAAFRGQIRTRRHTRHLAMLFFLFFFSFSLFCTTRVVLDIFAKFGLWPLLLCVFCNAGALFVASFTV